MRLVRALWLIVAIGLVVAGCVVRVDDSRVIVLSTRVGVLETRVAVLETTLAGTLMPTATLTQTLAQTATATPTLVQTLTRTPTATATFIRTLTATPTQAQTLTVRLTVFAPSEFQPASYVTFTLGWNGPTARVVLTPPSARVGYYDAPGDCGSLCWTATGGWTRQVRLWMFSTWRAGETATFTISAFAGDEVLASWVGVLACGSGTAQPTATPVPTATPTVGTPVATLRLQPRTWTRMENPTGAEVLWLYVCGFPVGSPGGQVWTFREDGAPLDWQIATSQTWARLETGGGDVLLWVDTAGTLEICDVRWYGREQTWSPYCQPGWWGGEQWGYPVCE